MAALTPLCPQLRAASRPAAPAPGETPTNDAAAPPPHAPEGDGLRVRVWSCPRPFPSHLPGPLASVPPARAAPPGGRRRLAAPAGPAQGPAHPGPVGQVRTGPGAGAGPPPARRWRLQRARVRTRPARSPERPPRPRPRRAPRGDTCARGARPSRSGPSTASHTRRRAPSIARRAPGRRAPPAVTSPAAPAPQPGRPQRLRPGRRHSPRSAAPLASRRLRPLRECVRRRSAPARHTGSGAPWRPARPLRPAPRGPCPAPCVGGMGSSGGRQRPSAGNGRLSCGRSDGTTGLRA